MNQRTLLCLCLFFFSPTAIAACSGVPNPGLGDTGDAGATPTGQETPTADAGADQTVSTGPSGADAAGPPARAPDTGTPVVPLAEAGAQDAGSSLDGAAPPADAGSPDAVAPAADGGPTFSCGAAPCSVSSQSCCLEPGAAACVNGATCPPTADATLHCAAAGDCPGRMVCCLAQNPAGSQCRAQCGAGDRELCDPAVDGGCTNTQRCGPANAGTLLRLPSDIGFCQ